MSIKTAMNVLQKANQDIQADLDMYISSIAVERLALVVTGESTFEKQFPDKFKSIVIDNSFATSYIAKHLEELKSLIEIHSSEKAEVIQDCIDKLGPDVSVIEDLQNTSHNTPATDDPLNSEVYREFKP